MIPDFMTGRETMKIAFLMTAALAASIMPAAAQAQTIAQRKVNQQDRIAQGVRSGQLTPHETAKLEHKEAKLNRETRRMRANNGGRLTPAEKAKVTRQQNQLSRDIYKQKHDAQHR
jgi:broad specificity phosphatase PhoE